MKKNLYLFIFLIVIILAGVVMWYFSEGSNNSSPSVSPSPSPSASLPPIAQVTYICNGDKTIDAAFYKVETKIVEPGEPPIPSGSVKIVLSDGRSFDLPQTISADGGRYANSDESFVFWSKGNGALVLENNVEKSYTGCVLLAKDPGGLQKIYLDGTIGFSIRYPVDYLIDTSYKYQALGPGKDISGVKFTIPSSLATGTNLSSFDTGISIETIPAVQNCNASRFLDGSTNIQIITDNDIEYSFASVTQGAAGNIYEEEVWAVPGTNPCIAVRYFIHSGNIGNYPEGAVSEFNRANLINQFDKIRRSLTTL
ncbi:MAG: MliC family protein [Candidatus Parcubacteria bacterium]|nr:MliC family protein [Candidatus Parcubacteria bacterium]